MIKCKLCGFECEGGRSAHGHMNRVHHKEYLEVDCDLEKVTEGYTRKKQKQYTTSTSGSSYEKPKKEERSAGYNKPKNLRLLNKSIPEELEAYELDHKFFDPDMGIAYTTEECKKFGWL